MHDASTMRIRLADDADVEDVHRIMLAAFEGTRRYDHPSSALRETVDDVRRALASPGTDDAIRRGIVAELAGERLGSGRFAVQSHPPVTGAMIAEAAAGHAARRAPGGALFYERLAVLPAHQGRGVGGAMIDWLEALARKLRLEAVETTVRSQQPDNRPYYLARGYEITGYSGRYGIPDLRTHVRKVLGPPGGVPG